MKDRGHGTGSGTVVGRLLRWVGRYVHGFYAAAGIVLSAALVLALIGLWGLSLLTEDVLEGDTARLDRAILLWLNGNATPWLDGAAVAITALGDTLVVLTLALVSATFLWLLGKKAYASLLVAAVAGASVITPVLKTIFDRPRPQVFEWRAHYAEASAAYPSGHATLSMVTLVTVAFIIHRLSSHRWTSAVAGALAGLLILLIGASRLYLGLHFPSDVVAGYVVGFAWAVMCALTIAALRGWGSLRERPGSRSAPETSQ